MCVNDLFLSALYPHCEGHFPSPRPHSGSLSVTLHPERFQIVAAFSGCCGGGPACLEGRCSIRLSYGRLDAVRTCRSTACYQRSAEGPSLLLLSGCCPPCGQVFSLGFRKWRRERDSNPRNLAVQRFSRPPQSTTLPSLRDRARILGADAAQCDASDKTRVCG